MRWQPIETAPKDGSVIIGWVSGWLPSAVVYQNDGAGWDESDPGWYDHINQVWASPTHWMPLPDPPDTALSPCNRR